MSDAERRRGVVVAQLGARRHYAVPVALGRSGLLKRFYTDLYAGSTAVRTVAGWVGRLGIRAADRLSRRADPGLPPSRVRSFPLFGLRYKWKARAAERTNSLTGVWTWAGETFCRKIIADGYGQAEAVFGYSSAALELFEDARRHGSLCILDHATAPRRLELELVGEMRDRYPGWAAHPPADPWLDEYAERQQREAHLADVILCGSEFVRDAVEQDSQQGHKCVILPLGLTSFPPGAPRDGRIGPLRVLFVGDEAIRKGIGDLATAIKLIGEDLCEVRAVGKMALSDRGRQHASEVMTLLGPVPRASMSAQYEWADVLALPSVSDTFGLVVLEAMAHGVPVITTTHTGAATAVRDGIDGYVVPPMRPEIIASKLESFARDRELLSAMAVEARKRAGEFTLDRYATNLASVICDRLGTGRRDGAARMRQS